MKKKTPTHDLSWYIKWLATFTIIVGAVFNSFEIVPYNLFIMASGVLLWLLVGFIVVRPCINCFEHSHTRDILQWYYNALQL